VLFRSIFSSDGSIGSIDRSKTIETGLISCVSESEKYRLRFVSIKPKSTLYSTFSSLFAVLILSLLSILALEFVIIRFFLRRFLRPLKHLEEIAGETSPSPPGRTESISLQEVDIALSAITGLRHQNEELSKENHLFRTISTEILKKNRNDAGVDSPLIDKMDSYIRDNYGNRNFSTKILADQFNMSVSNLSHYFKKRHQGITISDTINILRMETACNCLINTDLTLQEIIDRIGYCEVSAFIRKFKETYGCTPGEYRKKSTTSL
jgi:AraC-like DNA-binding protein